MLQFCFFLEHFNIGWKALLDVVYLPIWSFVWNRRQEGRKQTQTCLFYVLLQLAFVCNATDASMCNDQTKPHKNATLV